MEDAQNLGNTRINLLMDDISRSFLTAELNVKYWGYLESRYRAVVTSTAVFLLVMCISTVAHVVSSWATSSQPFSRVIDTVWGVCSICAAIAAAILLLLDYPKKIQSAARLREKWSEIEFEYHTLWLNTPEMFLDETNEIRAQYDSIREKEFRLDTDPADLPINKGRLIDKCQDEILNSKGLLQTE